MRDEKDVRRDLYKMKLRHANEMKSLIEELVKIEARKPPKPFVLPDGRFVEYVGPWPVPPLD